MLCVAAIIGLAGCQSRAPQPMLQATGGLLITQPTLKFDGKVGDVQYEPFALAQVSTRIGKDLVITSATMNGSEFSVMGPKPGPVLDGVTLVHEALRGFDITSTKGRADFQKRLRELFAIHKATTKGLLVTEGGIVILSP